MVNYYYKHQYYHIYLPKTQLASDIVFKKTNKSFNKILSVNVNGKDVYEDMKSFAGPFGNFYEIPTTFKDLYHDAVDVVIINEMGEMVSIPPETEINSLI